VVVFGDSLFAGYGLEPSQGFAPALERALRERFAGRGGEVFAPSPRLATDNAAMIALAGAERLLLGLTDPLDVAARPRWPLDEAMAASNPIHKPSRKGAKA
jgi:N6-L-threonylcarbamoyladenine synthase